MLEDSVITPVLDIIVYVICSIIILLNLYQIYVESRLKTQSGKIIYFYHRINIVTSIFMLLSHTMDLNIQEQRVVLYFSYFLINIVILITFLYTSYNMIISHHAALTLSTDDADGINLIYSTLGVLLCICFIVCWIVVFSLNVLINQFI